MIDNIDDFSFWVCWDEIEKYGVEILLMQGGHIHTPMNATTTLDDALEFIRRWCDARGIKGYLKPEMAGGCDMTIYLKEKDV